MDCAIYRLPLRSISKGKEKGGGKGERRKRKGKEKGEKKNLREQRRIGWHCPRWLRHLFSSEKILSPKNFLNTHPPYFFNALMTEMSGPGRRDLN